MKKLKKSGSLRRKIQNAIFKSTLFSQILMACILIPALIMILIPIGQIMTRGIAIEIAQRYDSGELSKPSKRDINLSSLTHTTEESLINEILNNNKEVDGESVNSIGEAIVVSEDFFKMPVLTVEKNSTDLKKLILICAQQYENSNDYFNSKVVPFKIYTLDFKVNDYAFVLPNEKIKRPLAKQNIVEKYINTTSSEMIITDEENIPIGNLSVGINPNIITLLVIPYLMLMLFVAFGSLIIVNLLGKFMTASILKPMDTLNLKLSAMAKGDLDNLPDHPIAIQKAPREIKQLIDSSNEILVRMTESRQQVESQNTELQSQNDELSHSKSIIQKQQNQLVQTEKMASVGQLSAAIVHEINTPVGAIKSNAQMIDMLYQQMAEKSFAEEDLKPLHKIKGLNDIVLQASERVIAIVKSLKSYSRLDQSDFKASDINEDLKNVLVLTSNLWKNNIQIQENYGAIPMVKCYSGLLNQVFMNLIVNAIDAMEHGGTLTLETTATQDEVLIAIKDTGSGIEPENLLRIFEEGFTTKSKNKGSGLGLALSQDVVRRHNGRIEVESSLGEGSIFTVYLPIDNDRT